MPREYFCAYHSYLKSIETLSDAEIGRLFTACLAYSETGISPKLSGNERHVYPTIKAQIDRDRDKYTSFIKKQSENGKKGGAPVGNQNARIYHPDQDYEEQAEQPKPIQTSLRKGEGKGKGKGERSRDIGAAPSAPLLPVMDSQEWKDFVAMRSKIKKPMTDRAASMAVSELEKLAPGNLSMQKEILNQSTYNCWQGLFQLKGGDVNGAGGNWRNYGKGIAASPESRNTSSNMPRYGHVAGTKTE